MFSHCGGLPFLLSIESADHTHTSPSVYASSSSMHRMGCRFWPRLRIRVPYALPVCPSEPVINCSTQAGQSQSPANPIAHPASLIAARRSPLLSQVTTFRRLAEQPRCYTTTLQYLEARATADRLEMHPGGLGGNASQGQKDHAVLRFLTSILRTAVQR